MTFLFLLILYVAYESVSARNKFLKQTPDEVVSFAFDGAAVICVVMNAV